MLYETLQHFKHQELRQYLSEKEASNQRYYQRKLDKSSFALGFALALLLGSLISFVIAENLWEPSADPNAISKLLLLGGSLIIFIRFCIPKS